MQTARRKIERSVPFTSVLTVYHARKRGLQNSLRALEKHSATIFND